MERTFKKGDLVECINNSWCPECLTDDKIYEVLDVNGDVIYVKCDDSVLRGFKPFRFKLHKAVEEQPTTETLKQTEIERKFKKGDLLLCADGIPGKLTEGNVYEALSYDVGSRVEIRCDDGFNRNIVTSLFELHCSVEQLEPLSSIDMVNNPPHYTQGSVECIEAIKAALTDEEFRGYCKGNAIKYIWREKHKGGKESIEKAIWYLKQLL